jgi:hypothetical protein
MLANALEVSDKHPELINVNNRAAAELRRLHAEVETLRAALAEQKEKYTWGTPLLDAALLASKPGQLKDRGTK